MTSPQAALAANHAEKLRRTLVIARVAFWLSLLPAAIGLAWYCLPSEYGAVLGKRLFFVSLVPWAASLAYGFYSRDAASKLGIRTPLQATIAIVVGLVPVAASMVAAIWAAAMVAFFVAAQLLIRGRQLVRRGRPQLPLLTPDLVTSNELGLPHEAVAAWLVNAQTELASVAAFNHLANELLALGAPAPLVRGAVQASLEEVGHAELCFTVIGRPWMLSAFEAAVSPPERPTTLTAVARDSLVEGCIGEAASALVAAELAAHPGVPAHIAQALRTIAVEEHAHAEHGWQVLAWCLDQDSPSVEKALRTALEEYRRRDGSVPGAPGLRQYGIADAELWARSLESALQLAEERLSTEVLRTASARALAACASPPSAHSLAL